MSCGRRYQQLLAAIAEEALRAGRDPTSITLVPISKTHLPERIQKVYDVGCRHFGENRVQEWLPKADALPPDISWHFVGTLQRKKVPKVIGRAALIHSVDSLELAERISYVSSERSVTTHILLETNTSGELSKAGQSPDAWKQCLERLLGLPDLAIDGLMTMAPFTEDETVLRAAFAGLRLLRDELHGLAGDRANFRHLSMGMTNDWRLAVAEGATLLRIGTAIFAPQD